MAYKVPFVDVPTHFRQLREPFLETIERVLSRGNLVLRDELKEFEVRFASFVGTRYAVGVGSGTDALHLALRAIGFQKGDEIITPCHSCIATVAAIVHAGATPVLVDVAEDCNMDMDKVEEAITPRTRAIVPVHLNGRACDMQRVLEISRKYGLPVIEDVAQAVGAQFDGRLVGSFGLAAAFSLYPFKVLGAFGEAGMVATNDAEIARKVSILRDYGQDRETGEILYFGFNSKLDNLQAAILNLKLQYLPQWLERRRTIAEMYGKGLVDVPYLKLPHFDGEKYFDVYLNYCIRAQERDALAGYLRECGIEPLTPISLAHPIHHHKALGLDRFHLPQTDAIAKEFLYLPIHPELSDEQVAYVVRCVHSFYDRATAGAGALRRAGAAPVT